MNKLNIGLIFVLSLLSSGWTGRSLAEERVNSNQLLLNPDDRILIFAPHPDDEILGTGGVIQRAVSMNLPIRVVFLTYGDNNAWSFSFYKKSPVFKPGTMKMMGEIRRKEAIKASKVLGLDEKNLIFLGYPDHGTMNIWCFNWGNKPAYRSMLTETSSVPYHDAYRYLAPYKGEEILKDYESIIRDFKPTKIFVANPADENPDHRADYLFLRVALWNLGSSTHPEIYPFLIHYRFRHWPVPEGYYPQKPLLPPSIFQRFMKGTYFNLRPMEIAKKFEAIHEHKTQFLYSGKYLSSFVRTNELFGDFPIYQVTGSNPVYLEEGDVIVPSELPDELNEEEKAQYLNLEKRRADVEDESLIVSTYYMSEWRGNVKFFISLFGYRRDRPFSEMPKIRVELGRVVERLFDGKKKIDKKLIQVVRQTNQITVKIPKSLLGEPTYVLTGVQSTLDEFPMRSMAWRILELSD